VFVVCNGTHLPAIILCCPLSLQMLSGHLEVCNGHHQELARRSNCCSGCRPISYTTQQHAILLVVNVSWLQQDLVPVKHDEAVLWLLALAYGVSAARLFMALAALRQPYALSRRVCV
jgi:hypothetical protein